ncbi:hypothetical protein KKA53_04540 [Candidatus Dependentiae bacterium]|nr:hypothetical protein [Candidatus Dependentiae bacterium]
MRNPLSRLFVSSLLFFVAATPNLFSMRSCLCCLKCCFGDKRKTYVVPFNSSNSNPTIVVSNSSANIAQEKTYRPATTEITNKLFDSIIDEGSSICFFVKSEILEQKSKLKKLKIYLTKQVLPRFDSKNGMPVTHVELVFIKKTTVNLLFENKTPPFIRTEMFNQKELSFIINKLPLTLFDDASWINKKNHAGLILNTNVDCYFESKSTSKHPFL